MRLQKLFETILYSVEELLNLSSPVYRLVNGYYWADFGTQRIILRRCVWIEISPKNHLRTF